MSVKTSDHTVIVDAESKKSSFTEEDRVSTLQQHDSNQELRWKPDIIQPRTLSGLLALAAAIVCMFAALGVLLASDRKPVDSWRVQPTVPLAILSAVGAGAVRYAKGCASPVAWWYKAMQGETVRRLEDQWQASRGVVGALTNLRRGGWISMATLLVTLMIIDGAMLQRASSVALVTMTYPITVQVPLSPEVPFGASGIEANGAIVPTEVSTQVVNDFMVNTPLLAAIPGCPLNSTCSGTVLGPGVSIGTCHNQTWDITPAMLHDGLARWGTIHGTENNITDIAPGSVTIHTNSIFQVIVEPPWAGNITDETIGKRSTAARRQRRKPRSGFLKAREQAQVFTGIANWDTTSGQFVERTCILNPSILEYDIQITNGEISLASSFSNARFYALANNTAKPAHENEIQVTLDQLTFSLAAIWMANATAVLWPNSPPEMIWQANPITFNSKVAEYFDWNDGLGVEFADPFDDILSSFNNVMFRTGLATANWANITSSLDAGLSSNQTISATQSVTENIYTSDYRWFAGAAVLDVLTVLMVLPLFWGWWTLPKHLTNNSPFDMALAFDSPLVTDINSAAGSPAVLDRLGDTRIAYGVAKGGSGLSRTASLASPVSRENVSMREMGMPRLGIAEREHITRPRRGELIGV